MQKTGILAKNFIHILRNGAFNESKPLGRLSPFKWNQLTLLATHHNLLVTYANGLEKYYYNDNFNIRQNEIDTIKAKLQEVKRHFLFYWDCLDLLFFLLFFAINMPVVLKQASSCLNRLLL